MNHNILTLLELKTAEENTCLLKGITTLDLMEEAGLKLSQCFQRVTSANKKDKISVVSGMGKNGGDALVMARFLLEEGYSVSISLVGKASDMAKETKTNLTILKERNQDVLQIDLLEHFSLFESFIANSSYIIDGLFGLGLNKPIIGIQKEIISCINQSKAFVFSIDIPSGINGNNGLVSGVAIQANYTAVIQAFVPGNLLNDALDYSLKNEVLDIGVIINQQEQEKQLIEEFVLNLPKRKHHSSKYDNGNILVIGGSIGMMGAPELSAHSALRTGSGLVSILLKKVELPFMNLKTIEIMLKGYDAVEESFEFIRKSDALVFGPGLAQDDKNASILKQLLSTNKKMVIDGTGIKILSNLLEEGSNQKNIVLTPHVGELAFLMEKNSSDIKDCPLKYINQLTEKGFTVILKGATTIVANSYRVVFMNKGNPGMATAGSGDVLSGIVASLLGEGIPPFEAALYGVWIHSDAGNMAKAFFGERSMIASDIISNISNVLKTQ
ncbi:MAG: NAD(P)H-hydrate dehydratase [Firmicutes bacterium]|nr:NAD(P)H-hydrate dehydratase [Bacillota bacterium]